MQWQVPGSSLPFSDHFVASCNEHDDLAKAKEEVKLTPQKYAHNKLELVLLLGKTASVRGATLVWSKLGRSHIYTGCTRVVNGAHKYSKQGCMRTARNQPPSISKRSKLIFLCWTLPWPRLVRLLLLPPKPEAIPSLQLVEVTLTSLEVVERDRRISVHAATLQVCGLPNKDAHINSPAYMPKQR